jgi:ATP-dependent Clp protease protease subunit
MSIVLFIGCAGTSPGNYAPWEWTENKHLYDHSPEKINFDDPVLNQRKVIISSYICPTLSNEVLAKLFYLDSKETKPIDIYLNSNGGYDDDAMAIYDAIHLLKSPVNVHAIGCCRSSSILILLGATGKRYATPNALLQVHTTECDTLVQYTDKYIDKKYRVEKIYKDKTKLPLDWYPYLGTRYFSVTAKEAIEFGLVDEITEKSN